MVYPHRVTGVQEVQEVQSVNSAYTPQGDASLSGTFDAGDIRSINLATWQSPS